METRYNASGMKIDWTDLLKQIEDTVHQIKMQGKNMTRHKLCNSIDLTYSWIIRAMKTGKMRIKTINKLKRVWINVKIIG